MGSRFRTSAQFTLALCLHVAAVSADVVTVEGTIDVIDIEERQLTLAIKGEMLELDISRKAKVSASGGRVEMAVLKSGLNVKVAYHDDLDVAVSIDVQGDIPNEATGEPELLEVSELSPDGNPQYPWLSPDGLTIYWEEPGSKGSAVWTAQRADIDSLFEGKKRLFNGRHPTVSDDGLEMILLVKGVLHSTTRASTDSSFKRPRAIRVLRGEASVKNPSLASDRRTLYFNRSGRNTSEFAMSRRNSRSSKWDRPQPVPIKKTKVKGALTWLQVTDDGLRLFCANEGNPRPDGNLMMWTRETIEDSFSEFEYIEFPEIDPLHGRSPRFIESTGELFFTQGKGPKKWGISVIKNFAGVSE